MANRGPLVWIRLLALGIFLIPGMSFGVELAPGGLVLFDGSGIHLLDPVTLAPSQISDALGFGGGTHHLVVDRRGRLLVTDEARGVVEVSPATGSKSVFVPVEALGGPPRGLGLGADGSILVSVQSAPPRVMRVDAYSGARSIIAEGGLLVAPTGIAAARDGTILVADQSAPTTNPIAGLQSLGALIRIDATTGQQVRVAADPFFQAPQDVACVGDSVWMVNSGLGRRVGKAGLTITRLSDGITTQAPVGFFGSSGVAAMLDGHIAYAACVPAHGDCTSLMVGVYGTDAWLSGFTGPLAVVPARDPPRAVALAPAAPNPFNNGTNLSFSLSASGSAELAIYSVDGRRVTTLVRGTFSAGSHSVSWDGSNAAGGQVRPGVYFARLRSAEGNLTRTLVRVR